MDKKQPKPTTKSVRPESKDSARRRPSPLAKKPKESTVVRLNKFIADSGVCSRRKADELIRDGAVRVNGKTAEFGMKVNITIDQVFVNNKQVKSAPEKVYILFNKPAQVMTTMSDPQGRPTVADFVEHLSYRVFPVGRLDWDTEGLLLLTNDGEFANRVMHPKHGIAKTYLAKLNGQPSEDHLKKLRYGVTIEGGKARALLAEKLNRRGSEQYDWIKIVIDEGRNRQVRRMIEKIGFDVKKLQRVAIGRLTMGDLERGKMRFLGPKDIIRIFMTEEDVARREEAKKSQRIPKSSKGTGGPVADESHIHPARRTGAGRHKSTKKTSYNPKYRNKGGAGGGRPRSGTRD
ncbi:MAG: pseudouridine synthase [Bdellovibrionota bacterium]